jgi:hypothetical protein
MLTAERANKFVLLELPCIPIYQTCPFIHLMTCFLVKLVLVVVVLLFEFLRKLPDDIILELEQFTLLFVMLQ